jgi:hypothetical protein
MPFGMSELVHYPELLLVGHSVRLRPGRKLGLFAGADSPSIICAHLYLRGGSKIQHAYVAQISVCFHYGLATRECDCIRVHVHRELDQPNTTPFETIVFA